MLFSWPQAVGFAQRSCRPSAGQRMPLEFNVGVQRWNVEHNGIWNSPKVFFEFEQFKRFKFRELLEVSLVWTSYKLHLMSLLACIELIRHAVEACHYRTGLIMINYIEALKRTTAFLEHRNYELGKWFINSNLELLKNIANELARPSRVLNLDMAI